PAATLAIAAGATVVSDSARDDAITLRAGDLAIDTSAPRAVVGAHRSTSNAAPTATLFGLSAPSALAFDAHGNLYVANSSPGTVSVFAPGSTTPTATLTGLAGPQALAIDAAGNLYVANSTGTTVSKFAPGGTTPSANLGGPAGPRALAFDANGNLFVANAGP